MVKNIRFKTIANVKPVITSGLIKGIFDVDCTYALTVLFLCLQSAKTVINESNITKIDVEIPSKKEFTNASQCDFEKSSTYAS